MLGAPAMNPPGGTDKRSTVVYVGGIGNGEDQDVIRADIQRLYKQHVDDKVKPEVTMHLNNDKLYALITCKNAELALKALEQLDKKPLKDSIPFTIGDKEKYWDFIDQLRRKLCGEKPEYIVYHLEKTFSKPVLPVQQRGKQPEQWINIDIQSERNGTASKTTLVVRNDSVYVKGFRNQKGEWFELRRPDETAKEKLPAEDYMDAKELKGWGLVYATIMGLNGSGQMKRTLETARLGRAFAERAVRRLSLYPGTDYNDDMPVRLGLAGLMMMICEAARMDAFLKHFAGSEGDNTQGGAWEQGLGMGAEKEMLFNFLWNWKNMSAALLKRNRNPYRPWDSGCGVPTAQAAINCVHLVLHSKDVTRCGGAQVEILDVSVSDNFRVLEITLINEEQKPHGRIYYTENNPDDCKNQEDKKLKEPNVSDADTDNKGENDPSDTNKISKPETDDLSEKDETNKSDGAKVQEDNKEMQRLKLTATDKKCISAHKWFSMNVVTSRGTVDRITREFKWDCRKQAGGHAATELVARTIDDLDSGDKIKVTYLVMSKAVKATVNVVNLWLKEAESQDLLHEKDSGGDTPATATEDVNKYTAQGTGKKMDGAGSKMYTAYGKITAHIGGFNEHPIVLFERSEEKAIPLESAMIFDRSAVHVPKGKQLQIDMNGLGITETSRSNSQLAHEKAVKIKIPCSDQEGNKVSFPFGKSRPANIHAEKDDGNQFVFLQVDVAWAMPYEPDPAAVFTIGEDQFTAFIGKVREAFADQDLSRYPGKTWRPTRPRPTNGQPDQWIHVKLQMETGGLSTTLAVQDGKCYGVGFMNQSRVWYDLGYGNQQRRDKKLRLPKRYNSVLLGWGLSFDHILGLTDWNKVYSELNSEGLGKKSFAEKAVRTLSRYPDVDEDDLNPRVAVAGLILMVCESARFNPVLKYFQDNWDNVDDTVTGFSWEEMKYIWSWGKISRALLLWTDSDSRSWPEDDQTTILEERQITNQHEAEAAVYLVYSDARTLKFHATASSGSTTDQLDGKE